ncbi:peptide-methionine (S)-S-oxide reductase MsrA [Psychromonas sp. RZ22]|uniref:peptide-methionine (S)-S-oxide reductase MsrA n=1 Tax=Psychromonas algarum TaxID=2555643 RepID=UPI0010674B20|nr:peptide-methionine (S)-S-oxide reductase MsrA [Psychromonas sp. RZ22]TEW55375.1 peptide-methionine (S)-S-oxide reductase MsrA [Psychromonas sp. RZ22]
MAQQNMIVGGGCFWCVEAAFNQVKGVISAVSGYCGGQAEDANYEKICTGNTGHVEVVNITFDDQQINFAQLLHLFFSVHDATQVNRQGNDIGTQYRSVIFYQNADQQKIALSLIEEFNQKQLFDKNVATSVEPAGLFYSAEDYHQGYYLKNPEQGYCMAVVAPKFQKFKAQHQQLLK